MHFKQKKITFADSNLSDSLSHDGFFFSVSQLFACKHNSAYRHLVPGSVRWGRSYGSSSQIDLFKAEVGWMFRSKTAKAGVLDRSVLTVTPLLRYTSVYIQAFYFEIVHRNHNYALHMTVED